MNGPGAERGTDVAQTNPPDGSSNDSFEEDYAIGVAAGCISTRGAPELSED
jgi:hypothetical protein